MPLGRRHDAITVPTGSLSLRITSTPAAMASTRLASSVSRSRKAEAAPADFASATSSALAARIAAREPRMRPWPWRPARDSCATPARSASACAAARARRPISRMVASSVPAFPTALSGAFMALIRLALWLPTMFRRAAARQLRRVPGCPHRSTALRAHGHRNTRNLSNAKGVSPRYLREGGFSWVCRRSHTPSRLPRRFPVGATYVVEGYGGDEGNFRVIARYVVLPGGRRINVPADLSSPPAPRALAFRRTGNAKQSQPKSRSARQRQKNRGTARNRLTDGCVE